MGAKSSTWAIFVGLGLGGLAGCGGSGGGGAGGGGGGGSAPEIEVFTTRALLTSGGGTGMGVIGQDQFVAVPILIRNLGTAVLNLTGAIGIVPTNCTCTLRDAAPTTVAAGDTGVFTLLFKAGTSGNPTASISILNDDADESPFTSTISFSLDTATRCTYTAPIVAQGQNLFSSAFPGAPGTVQVNGGVTTGTGVQQNWHLVDRSLYVCQFTSAGDTDLFLRGLGAALPAAQTNLTSALSTGSTFFAEVKFAAGDNLVFGLGVSGGATRLHSLTINGAVTTAPVEISGSVPGGSPAGIQTFFVSPRKDQVAFTGDFATAGTHELFVVPFAGGTRVKVSAALGAGRSLDIGSIRWLPDQSGILYETRVTATNQQRLLHLVALGGVNPVTDLNGPVAAGRTGVIATTAGPGQPQRVRVATTGTHVFFLTDEASASGKRELRVRSLIGGVVSSAGVLNASVPGNTGVAEFGIAFGGTKVLFTADSGALQEQELWQSLIAGSTPTTTRIVPIAAAGRSVQFDGERGMLSGSLAWCTQNDQSAGRQELFALNLTSAVPTLTRIVNTATFAGGTGPILANIFPQPDFHVAFNSNQGNANGSIFGASLTGALGNAVRLQARTTAGTPNVMGLRVAYEADNGAVPQDAFCNLITGSAEIQMGTSSNLVGSPILFSEARGFWHTLSPNLFNASTTSAGTQQDTDAIGGSDIGSVRLGFEPRP